MEAVIKMNDAIFERAAKAVRTGTTHPTVVIVDSGRVGERWKVIDVSQQMGSDADKDMVASFINMLSHHPDVAIIAFVAEAWYTADQKAIKEGTRPSTAADRKECLVVSFSFGNQRALVMHPIVRTLNKKPRLERGELKIETQDEKLDGRFFAERRAVH